METERINNRSRVVASVTLGKELHAGHMLLLATADLVRLGLGSEEPLYLINNNTGPRPAGTLVAAAESLGGDLLSTARAMDAGMISAESIIKFYRNRLEGGEQFTEALSILEEGGLDIFSSMRRRMSRCLGESNFLTSLVSESDFLRTTDGFLSAANPIWRGSGFCFSDNGSTVRVLQKVGRLTASGKGGVVLFGLAEDLGDSSVVFVDGSPDSVDSVASLRLILGEDRAMQLPGAAVGFGGKMASGSRGEAFTLSQIQRECVQRPSFNLARALRQLVLTTPMTIAAPQTPDLATAFYDFADNQSLIRRLIDSDQQAGEFESEISQALASIDQKIGGTSRASEGPAEVFLKFLPQKSSDLLKTSPEKLISSMSRGKLLRNSIEVAGAVERQGYGGDDAEAMRRKYLNGQMGLVFRQNTFFNALQALMRLESNIISLTEEDSLVASKMLRFAAERLGYEIG